jgi:retinol dehydrogenase 12
VVDEIIASGGSAEMLIIDLASLESVRTAARDFENRGRTVDVLINNAGIGMARGVTEDGFEVNFGVNHLGPFLLTHLLRRTFRPGTRIISVSSGMHNRARGIDFDRLQEKSRSFFGLDEYAVSKLANILFATEIARRHPDWRSYAVHPGLVDTGIFPFWVKPFLGRRMLTPEQGAETTIWCATDGSLASESGGYYTRSAPATPSELASDDELARELWVRSERWCGVGPVD